MCTRDCSGITIKLYYKQIDHYMYNNNGNQQVSQEFPVGQCIKKAMTKVRANLNEQGSNRGILIVNPQTYEERWVSVPADDLVAQAQNGTPLYFHGKGQRPSLTLFSQHQANIVSGGQYAVQRTSSLVEQIEGSMYPRDTQMEITPQYNNNHHLSPPSNFQGQPRSTGGQADEDLIEKLGVIYGHCANLSASLNPQLSQDNQTKIAISMAIQYYRIKGDTPF